MMWREHSETLDDTPEVDAETADRIYELFDEERPDGALENNPPLLALIRAALPGFIMKDARYEFGGYGGGTPKALDLTFVSRETDPRGETREIVRIRPSRYGFGIDYASRVVRVPMTKEEERAARAKWAQQT